MSNQGGNDDPQALKQRIAMLEAELARTRDGLTDANIQLAYFQEMTETSSEVFWLTDWINNEILYVSPAYLKVWGRTPESLIENPGSWTAAMHPDDRDRVYESFKENAAAGRYSEEYRIILPDGSMRWIYDRAFPVTDDAGRVIRVAGISMDISPRKRIELEVDQYKEILELKVDERTALLRETNTTLGREIEERRRVEAALRASDERYDLATRAAKVGVWDWNIETGEYYLDPNVKAILGYEDHEIPNDMRVWSLLMHPEDRRKILTELESHARGESESCTCEHRMIHKDGSIRWILTRGRVIRNSQNKVVRLLGTDTDITFLKKTLQEKEQLITDLQKALSEVKQLSGLLPICGRCKKIRDDSGYWNQLEIYFEKHSDVEFSHGLCPDCMKALIADYRKGND